MSVGWILPPGQSANALWPWVRLLVHSLDASELVLFWIERRPDEKRVHSLALSPDDLPNELRPIVRLICDDELFDESRPTENDRSPDSVDALPHATRSPARGLPVGTPPIPVSMLGCPLENWSAHVLQQVDDKKVLQLIVPRQPKERLDAPDNGELQNLLSEVHCEVIQLSAHAAPQESSEDAVETPTAEISTAETSTTYSAAKAGAAEFVESPASGQRMLVAAGTGLAGQLAIRRAYELAQTADAELTAVYVEPDVDDFASQAGDRILDQLLRAAVGDAAASINRRVELDDEVADGLIEAAQQYDLVILGTRHHGWVHRWFHRGLAEQLFKALDQTAIAVIRRPTPLGRRIYRSLDNLFRDAVPQLERDQRVALVERIQSSSQWDFDFVALIALSTLIATCGLLQSSTAVVIGGMLVAPLMTPLLAAGLSLVQGNPVLLRNGMLSVLRGFLLALFLAYGIGWIVRIGGGPSSLESFVTPEIAARGNPRILDLLVALVSGVAAAYANGRPNLLSALPGVAIASASVPPIASIGLGAAWGQWELCLGASLLFLTNIVAIVLGTAYAFWAVGIRGANRAGFFQSSTWRAVVGLLIVLIGLGIIESLPASGIPATMRVRVAGFLQEQPNVKLLSIDWLDPKAAEVVVRVSSHEPVSQGFLRQLAERVNAGRATALTVQVRTELVSTVAAEK